MVIREASKIFPTLRVRSCVGEENLGSRSCVWKGKGVGNILSGWGRGVR